MAEPTRCGFVALIGAPNAGKSTLMNTLVGQKVSIVSRKVQTTRTRVLGIETHGAAQLIYIDTPGIFQPRRRLDRAMVQAAWGGAGDADIIVLMVDALKKGEDEETAALIEKLARRDDRPLLVVLNKVDALKPAALLPIAETLSARLDPAGLFMLSALSGDGVADLRSALIARLPEGPWHYPEDQVVDLPSRLLAAEITREHLYDRLHDELPYQSTVETEQWEARRDGSLAVGQVIYVQRDSQKGIVLGKGGQQIREIGQRARLEMAEMFGRRVHLRLFVKVREHWGEDRDRFSALGLDYSA